MRKSSSCVVTLRDFAVWRAAVAAVALSAVAAVAAWAAATLAAQPAPSSGGVAGTAIVLALGIAFLAVSLAGVEPGVLSCHEGRWGFAPERSREPRPVPGELAVAIDLGSFLLLTLACSGTGTRRSRRWLPVQRRGRGHEWHALRCAVYSPPLVATDALAVHETPS
jgi:hypothetical protein